MSKRKSWLWKHYLQCRKIYLNEPTLHCSPLWDCKVIDSLGLGLLFWTVLTCNKSFDLWIEYLSDCINPLDLTLCLTWSSSCADWWHQKGRCKSGLPSMRNLHPRRPWPCCFGLCWKQRQLAQLSYLWWMPISVSIGFWPCHENGLIKAIQTIPHNMYVSVTLTSLYCG